MQEYDVVKDLPVARFYYKGNHSHPVRRTVLVIDDTTDVVKGYELRSGIDVRDYKEAPIKSFRKDKIAQIKQCGRRLRKRMPEHMLVSTTYQREDLLDLVKKGV
ncbi:MAG: hypothetical protein M0R80_02060 [Proteobacteria bacterium]|jgi:hypothetical protein|nr:hypothetical protein [Pseudomonadota bacterium]